MKTKLLTAATMSAALFASGCATTGTTGSVSVPTSAQLIADAQTAAEAICAIAPTAAAITSIIVAENSGAQATEQTATQAAQLFCSAVTRVSAKAPRKLGAVKGRALLDFGTVTVQGRVIDVQGYAL